MKFYFKKLAFMAALLAVCLVSFASHAKRHEGRQHSQQRRQHYVKKHNARVNKPSEARADRNNDGVVGPKEKWRSEHPHADVNKRWEKRADVNNDGIVSPKEAEPFRDRLEDKSKDGTFQNNHNNPKVNTRWEKQADVNEDGMIDERERRMWEQNH